MLKDIRVETLMVSDCPNFEFRNPSSSLGSVTDLQCDVVQVSFPLWALASQAVIGNGWTGMMC